MLLQRHRHRIIDVDHPVLAFFAVADEKLAALQIDILHEQGTDFSNPQATMPEQIETGQITNGQLLFTIVFGFCDGRLNTTFHSANLFQR